MGAQTALENRAVDPEAHVSNHRGYLWVSRQAVWRTKEKDTLTLGGQSQDCPPLTLNELSSILKSLTHLS